MANIFSKLFSGSKKDPYEEIQNFLNETLLPLGFQKEYVAGGPGLIHNHKYIRLNTLVLFAYDVREQEYFLSAAADTNKKKTVNGEEYTIYDFSISTHDLVNEETRPHIYQKFKRWLTENQIY